MPDEDIQVTDTTSTDNDQDIEINLDDSEDIEAQPEKTYSESQFKQVWARAKKLEAENKELKSKPAEAKESNPPSSQPVDIDERILLANGTPDELVKELKAIAKVRNVSLLDAQKDPIFVAIKGNFEKEQKEKSASLPASRGSGQAKTKKGFDTPGLSAEEHKAMYFDN